MSEIMTVEAILEARWILEKDYWTRTRFPYKTSKGGWSDFDVVAYSPQRGHLVLGEAKAQGTKQSVYVTRYSKKGDFQKFLAGIQFNDPYFSFIKNIMEWTELPEGLKDRIFKLNKITFHLLSNWIITLDEQGEESTVRNGTEALKKALEEKIIKFPFFEKHKDQPIKVELLWHSPMEVFAEILQKERESDQGRRYGNNIIDLARELNRFLFPKFLSSYGESLGSSMEWKKLLTSQITKSFLAEGLSSLPSFWQENQNRSYDMRKKPNFWWVNQGGSYDMGKNGNFIFSLLFNKSGGTPSHWGAIRDVRKDDIIFHYFRGFIKAVSCVSNEALKTNHPISHNVGLLVKTNYCELSAPIPLDGIPLNFRIKESPFNKNGAVNQGYLYPLTLNFAKELVSSFKSLQEIPILRTIFKESLLQNIWSE